MTVDPFDLFLAVPGPERPEDKIGPIRCREQRQAVNAAVFADPVPGLHMVGMRILSEAGGFGLLCRKQALLLLGYVEEPTRRISARLNHMHNTTTLLSFCAQSRGLLPWPTVDDLGNTGLYLYSSTLRWEKGLVGPPGLEPGTKAL